MINYLNGFYTYLFLAMSYSPCNAGLLDLLLGNNVSPQQRYYNTNNNNQNVNQLSRAIQRLDATRDRYNARNDNNWPRTTSLGTDNNDSINGNDSGDNDHISQDNGEVPDIIQNKMNSATNVARNSNNQNVVPNRISGIPFTNGNSDKSFSNRPLVNQFPTNNGVFNHGYNPIINTNTAIINRPITNRNPGNANLPKIIEDMNKINSIMDQIKQQNSNNHGSSDATLNSGFPSYSHSPHHSPGFTNNYPSIHINNGLSQGVHTNGNNQNDFIKPGTSIYTPKVQPQYNLPLTIDQETNLNTAVTNPPILTPVTGHLMTNIPNESQHNGPYDNYDNHQFKPTTNNSSEIDYGHSHASQETPKENESLSNHKRNEHNDKYVLKALTKWKFFIQVQPVIPECKVVKNNETIYYAD